jgi:rhomboid family GlyGly-CTERM serine protease
MAWLAIAVLAAGATCFPVLWSLDIELVRQGDLWRLFCGQLVHLSWQHYCYDLLALGMALWLCSWLASGFREITLAILCSAGAVALTMMLLQPVDVYGGLSGVVAGLLAWAAILLIRRDNHVPGLVLVVGMVIKIRTEQCGVSLSGVEAVWQAHCAGALAGALYGVLPHRMALIVVTKQEARSTP